MSLTKDEIVKKVNDHYTDPIAPKKKKTLENADPGKHKDLIQYNAILDHIRIGCHVKTSLNRYGIDWEFRLLAGDEQDQIMREILEEAKLHDCFEEAHLAYLEYRKVLARALTPSPFKTLGTDANKKDILSEEDLKYLPMTVLDSLFKEYKTFVSMACMEAENLPEEEAIKLIETIKKKPEVLKELNRQQLLTAIHYYRNCLQLLDETQK